MSRINSNDLKQERAALLDRAEAIRLMAEDNDRDMNEEEAADSIRSLTKRMDCWRR